MIRIIALFIISGLITLSHANNSYSLILSNKKGLAVESVRTPLGKTVKLDKKYPLFSIDLNDFQVSSLDAEIFHDSEQSTFKLNEIISGEIVVETGFTPGWKAIVIFKNISDTTVKISNVVPLGQSDDHLYLTASGPWSLSRTKIFRPNHGPVGVILPDNAWESGYSDIKVTNKFSICALSRRLEWKDAKRGRWQTVLQPGGTVSYVIYADGYEGTWQNGLRMIFQERYLYDLDKFDNSMFEREDIKWIRNKYTIALQFGWDHEFHRESSFRSNHFTWTNTLLPTRSLRNLLMQPITNQMIR